MKCVYIAGPITGVDNYEFFFMQRERKLKDFGYKVFNPVTLSKELKKKKPWYEPTHEEYMNFLLPYLLEADSISMLDGWEDSKGAKIEHDVAVATGKYFVDIKIFNPRWGK